MKLFCTHAETLAIFVFVAISVLTTAAAVKLPVVARPFKPSDIVGEYTRFLALPGAETKCPKKIQHKSYSVNPQNSSNFVISHSQILHDGVKCTGDGYTVVDDAGTVVNLDEFKRILQSDSGIATTVVSKVLANTDSMLGYELAERTCGNAVGFSKSTGYTFIHEHDRDIELLPGALTLENGYRYMLVLSSKDGKSISCAYNAAKEPTNATPAPLSDDSSSGDSSAMPEAQSSSDSDSGAKCFPASASVTLESGEIKNIEDLALGDRVHVGSNRYSDVFAFTHKLSTVCSTFVQISSASGDSISLSPGHYLYVNGQLTPADEVSVGDLVELSSGRFSAVVAVRRLTLRGLFNPQTIEGSIVVNGIRASTYTTAVHPVTAHALLSPLRTLYNLFKLAPLTLSKGPNSVRQCFALRVSTA